MPKTLNVAVSDELLAQLQQESGQVGKTPVGLAADYLSKLVPLPPGSRLRRWAGAINSGVPDASLRHDEYLGQAQFDALDESGR